MFTEYYERLKNQPKYVILGCQGSGTNLVSRLLQRTLRFSVVHDRSLIFNAATAVARDPSPATLNAEFKRIRRRIFPGTIRRRFMLKRHYRQARHFSGLDETIDTQRIKSGADFANYLYAYHGFSTDAKYHALKSDDLWESLEHIDVVLPRRRYLLLVRDPRDNAISITNKDFGPKNLFAAAEYVLKRMQYYKDETDLQDPADVLTITYEDLLNQPQREMERVAEHWRLDLDPAYADAIQQMEIRSYNKRKWENLSPSALRITESILRDMIVHYGYDLSGTATQGAAPGELQRACWRANDLAQRIPQRAYKTCRNLLKP